MQTSAGAFTYGIEALDAGLSIQIDFDASTHVMSRWCYRDVVLCDVNADGEALGIDVGEVVLGLFGILVCHVKAYMVKCMNLHFVVDSTCHDVTGSQRQTFIILLHEFLTVGQTQDATITAHRFGDEVGRMRLGRVEQHRRVELHKLHVLHLSFGTINHGDAVARGDVGVGCGGIDGACATCCHQGDFRQISVNLSRLWVQHISTETLDVGGAAGHTDAQMVLRDDFHSKMVLQHLNVGMVPHGFHQTALNLGTCVVSMMQDAEFGVPAFAVQVKRAVFLLVEIHAPSKQIFDTCRTTRHHLFHCFRVTNPVTGNHGVLNVLFEVIDEQVRH